MFCAGRSVSIAAAVASPLVALLLIIFVVNIIILLVNVRRQANKPHVPTIPEHGRIDGSRQKSFGATPDSEGRPQNLMLPGNMIAGVSASDRDNGPFRSMSNASDRSRSEDYRKPVLPSNLVARSSEYSCYGTHARGIIASQDSEGATICHNPRLPSHLIARPSRREMDKLISTTVIHIGDTDVAGNSERGGGTANHFLSPTSPRTEPKMTITVSEVDVETRSTTEQNETDVVGSAESEIDFSKLFPKLATSQTLQIPESSSPLSVQTASTDSELEARTGEDHQVTSELARSNSDLQDRSFMNILAYQTYMNYSK